MKINPMGAELSHAEGQTDMPNLIVAFRNFASAPKSKNFHTLQNVVGVRVITNKL
jgi:hypothetical protein